MIRIYARMYAEQRKHSFAYRSSKPPKFDAGASATFIFFHNSNLKSAISISPSDFIKQPAIPISSLNFNKKPSILISSSAYNKTSVTLTPFSDSIEEMMRGQATGGTENNTRGEVPKSRWKEPCWCGKDGRTEPDSDQARLLGPHLYRDTRRPYIV